MLLLKHIVAALRAGARGVLRGWSPSDRLPNGEWFRASLSRAVVMDRAKAHLAIGEMERCLGLHRIGGRCGRFNWDR